MIFYVLGFLFNDDGKSVVLIKKNRPSNLAGKWNGVGGKIDINSSTYEDAYIAMRRECFEETGLIINNWERFGELVGPEFQIALYAATTDLNINKPKTMETEKVKVFSVEDCISLPRVEHFDIVFAAARSFLFSDKPFSKILIQYNLPRDY